MGVMTRVFACSLVVAALAVAATAAAQPAAIAARCGGTQLKGTFSVVRGSAAAGSIVYALVLRNRSMRTCTLTGLPSVRLLGRTGKRLPTHVRAAFPGALTAVLVTLKPGQSTRATARFSPDVPGPGEPTAGKRCEPVAYRLRLFAQGGGTTTVPVKPPTSFCEHGSLQFSAYGIRG
jgi:hypothetical protein